MIFTSVGISNNLCSFMVWSIGMLIFAAGSSMVGSIGLLIFAAEGFSLPSSLRNSMIRSSGIIVWRGIDLGKLGGTCGRVFVNVQKEDM